ncbi:DUF6538 domain-containing protein [Vibrio sp. TRT 2004]|uniref:DUF6538 domain-containing protein n=1 Tax=Vibrio sp. TRT 2004 TaxID=3418506 RepID=UPI003CF4976F
MYLMRLPNSVYYTRVATPLSLRISGYPKEFKFSLLTRERKVASLRNIVQVQLLMALFEKAKLTAMCVSDFLKYLSAQGANQPTNSLAMAYRDGLIQRQLRVSDIKL